MGTEQETLIYIEDQDKLDASVAANAFAHKDVKNRAYINTLGAELALKYLASEDIDVSNIYNIHSIKKILEEMDISDIMLPNIHIDVRVVFDENVIFVPKSHFEYNLVPDIYLVFYLAKDLSHVKFLGFFDPKLINKNNANDKYYFIEKEKLSSAKDLKKYIETHQSTTNETLSEEDYSNSERIIVAMSDNDISEDDKKYLINQLTKSAELRDKFIEYENFETLSYKAMTDSEIKKPEIKDITETTPVDTNITEISDIVTEEEPTDVSENLEIDDIELEPIAPIEDIALDEDFNTDTTDVVNTTEAPKNIDEKSSNATDIAGTAIAGAAAGAIAGAAAGTAATRGPAPPQRSFPARPGPPPGRPRQASGSFQHLHFIDPPARLPADADQPPEDSLLQQPPVQLPPGQVLPSRPVGGGQQCHAAARRGHQRRHVLRRGDLVHRQHLGVHPPEQGHQPPRLGTPLHHIGAGAHVQLGDPVEQRRDLPPLVGHPHPPWRRPLPGGDGPHQIPQEGGLAQPRRGQDQGALQPPAL